MQAVAENRSSQSSLPAAFCQKMPPKIVEALREASKINMLPAQDEYPGLAGIHALARKRAHGSPQVWCVELKPGAALLFRVSESYERTLLVRAYDVVHIVDGRSQRELNAVADGAMLLGLVTMALATVR